MIRSATNACGLLSKALAAEKWENLINKGGVCQKTTKIS